MQLNRHRTAASVDTGILFPKLECWNPVTKMATVAAEVNKKRVLCQISLETLQDKFGASEGEPMRCVAEHRSTIQTAARRLIESSTYEKDGSVHIRAHDLLPT